MVMRIHLTALLLTFVLASSDALANGFSIRFSTGSGGTSVSVPGLSIPILGGNSQGRTAEEVAVHNQAVTALNEGCELSKQGREQEARQKFKQAVELDPNYELAWFNLTSADIGTGDLAEGIEVGKQFLARFPSSNKCARVTALMQRMQEELEKKQNADRTFGANRDDYLGLACADSGGIPHRWPAEWMPLKVYIEPARKIRGFRSEFALDLREAFREWTSASMGRVKFEFVDSPSEAKITCTWIDNVKDFPKHSGIEGGEAVPYLTADGRIVGAKLFILTFDPRKPITEAAIHHTCLHEIGHVLGLTGHSDNPDDVLYWAGSQEQQQETHLSARDANTIARLYGAQPIVEPSNIGAAPYSLPQADPGPPAGPQTGFYPSSPSGAFQAPPGSAPVLAQHPAMPVGAPNMALFPPPSIAPPVAPNMVPSGAPDVTALRAPNIASVPPNVAPIGAPNVSARIGAPMATQTQSVWPPQQPGWPQQQQQPQPQPTYGAKSWTGRPVVVKTSPFMGSSMSKTPMPITMNLQPKKSPTPGKYVHSGYRTSDEAIHNLEHAIWSRPNDPSLLDDLGTAYNNKAIELIGAGDLLGAERSYGQALAIHKNSPDSSKLTNTLSNYVLLLMKQNRSSEAEQLKQKCAEFVARYRLSQSM